MRKAQSKSYPEVKRLKHKIIFPVGIDTLQRTDEEGGSETYYEFYPIELTDQGEDISNKDAFARKRYVDLRKLSPIPYGYGTQDEQFEMQQEQGFSAWQTHCQGVKSNFPK